jgi:hypothetical protein
MTTEGYGPKWHTMISSSTVHLTPFDALCGETYPDLFGIHRKLKHPK